MPDRLIDRTPSENVAHAASSSAISPGRPRLRPLFPVLAVCLPILAYFAPILLYAAAPIDFEGDLATYFYPITVEGMAQWRAGDVPFWTDKLQTGFPLLADGQGALLHPLNIVLYYLLPGPLAHNSAVFLLSLLSAVTMYRLARFLALREEAAIAAAWIWLASAIFPSQSSPQLNAVALWPLLALLALRIASRRCLIGDLAFTALISALMWLGGFPQMAVYGIVLASGLLVAGMWAESPPVPRFKLTAISLAVWMMGLLLGLAIGAIQVLPTLEMSSSSVRAGGVEFGFAAQGSLLPSMVIGYLTPSWSISGFLSAPVYFGLLGLAFALLRLRLGISRMEVFLWLLVALALILSFGKYTPLYYGVSQLPAFSFLRVPARFTLLSGFALALLAAYGVHSMATADAEKWRALVAALRRRLRVLLACILVLSLAGSVLLGLLRPVLFSFAGRFVSQNLLGASYRVQGNEYYENKIDSLLNEIARALSPANPRLLQPALIVLLALVSLFAYRRLLAKRIAVRPNHLLAFLVVLLGLDLTLLAGNPFDRIAPSEVLTPPPIVSSLAQAAPQDYPGANRLYQLVTQEDIIRGHPWRESLLPNYNLMFGVPHVGVYSALGSVRYYDLLGPLGGVNLAYGLPPSSPDVLSDQLHVLDLIGARYVVASQVLSDPRLVLINASRPYLYQNSLALPRAFIVPRATAVSSDEALRHARSPNFNHLDDVLVEAASLPAIPPSSEGKLPTVSLVSTAGNTVTLRARGPGWLVLTDFHYPGWRAAVDGRDTPVYRANAVFRAVALPDAAEHTVAFHYEPGSFYLGLYLSVSAMFATLAILMLARGKDRDAW